MNREGSLLDNFTEDKREKIIYLINIGFGELESIRALRTAAGDLKLAEKRLCAKSTEIEAIARLKKYTGFSSAECKNALADHNGDEMKTRDKLLRVRQATMSFNAEDVKGAIGPGQSVGNDHYVDMALQNQQAAMQSPHVQGYNPIPQAPPAPTLNDASSEYGVIQLDNSSSSISSDHYSAIPDNNDTAGARRSQMASSVPPRISLSGHSPQPRDIVKEMPRSKSGGLDRTSTTGSRRANSASMRNSAQTPVLPYRKPVGVPGHPPANRSPRQHTPLNQYVAEASIAPIPPALMLNNDNDDDSKESGYVDVFAAVQQVKGGYGNLSRFADNNNNNNNNNNI